MIKTESDEKLPSIKIAFLDVGQADTIVISCADTHEAIVVDCVNAKAVRDYLIREQITQLRGIIITHLHADHYSGVTALLKNYQQVPSMQECRVVAFNEIFNQKNLQKLIQDADKHSSNYEMSSKGALYAVSASLQDLIDWRDQNDSKYALLQVQLGSSVPYQSDGTLIKSLHLLHPHAANFRRLEAKGLNNTSVVLQVIGPGSKALLTGDLEPEGWRQLCANHSDLRSNILKFPHHGGAWKDEDIDALLDKVDPSVVVISVGSEGFERYTHPHPDVFRALSKRPNIHVLCTQATSQCQELVLKARNSVIDRLKNEANKHADKLIGSKRGCPCAGTVIIELGEKAQVLQPELKFHRELIIEPHFKSHQCNIKQASAIDQVSLTRTETQTS